MVIEEKIPFTNTTSLSLSSVTPLTPAGLQAMLELLSSEYAVIQELGLRTMDNCMLDTQCRATFRELGGLEKVVEFIGNKVGQRSWA